MFFVVEISGQMNFSQFNKIGFGDLFRLRKISDTAIQPNELQTHYTQLLELGLTHVATYAADTVLNAYPNLKIIDRNFERDIYAQNSNNAAFRYSFAFGNKDLVPYELGGKSLTGSDELNRDILWGFGTSTQYRSLWQDTIDVTGNQNYDDFIYSKRVAYANVNDDSVGNLVFLTIPYEHQPYDSIETARFKIGFKYRLGLNMRINFRQDIPSTDTVLLIRIYEVNKTDGTKEELIPKQIKPIKLNPDTPGLDTTFIIVNNDTTDGIYKDILTPYFRKYRGYEANLVVKVSWLKKCNVYIDKAYVFNQYYESLFVDTSVISQTENSIRNSFIPNISDTNLSNYAHPYFDEPIHLQYYGQQKVSRLWEAAHGKYIKGADMFYQKDFLELINYLHEPYRPKYILSDRYPITASVDSSTSSPEQELFSLQTALNFLVDTVWDANPYGRKNRQGLRQMINWAHNFNSDHSVVSEHIPFYHTIQCQGEVYRDESGYAQLNLRRPTYNEIMAQGWLALCYGAKGLMYYSAMTETASGDTGYFLYGLFDSGVDNINSYGDLIYYANQEQVPNIRYYAVKELNNQIDAISSTLMNLTWYREIADMIQIP